MSDLEKLKTDIALLKKDAKTGELILKTKCLMSFVP